MTSRRNLQPAHQGYRYQDIATAFILTRALVDRSEQVVVDKKQLEGDQFDDLEVRLAGRRVRRQFKSSSSAARRLQIGDFTNASSSLRLDKLIVTHVRAAAPKAEEYRLCATWGIPLPGDPLEAFLERIVAPPTILGSQPSTFRFREDLLWPANGAPEWDFLTQDGLLEGGLDRGNVVEFLRRFVIELQLPQASTQLAIPGPLEGALIRALAEDVGIGRYPNHGRTPTDVAGLVISLAALARASGATLTPTDIERELELRVDFGRVAQAYPLDNHVFQDRPSFRSEVRVRALAGSHQLIVAPPGAGKSWELTRLSEELALAGAIVARHYCYLEPGDEIVERRVTTDVFFANLMGELIDAEPSLRGAGGAHYAAGIGELEAVLSKAVTTGRPVVLVIDGLDHIGRVLAQSSGLSHGDSDIVEHLATLNTPPGVSLVIGSQPGPHLEPLQDRLGDRLAVSPLPRWHQADLAALADRHGLSSALGAVGVVEEGQVSRVRLALAERAEGSPLYARYLVRGLIAGLADGTVAAPEEWIASAPAIDGDIASYYAHLYLTAGNEGQAIADMLGVIDFAVSEADLREMMPPAFAAWLPHVLSRLTPILVASAGQGGIRVFHESFRRFMIEELARQGRSAEDALMPVIRWLESRDFFADPKAYRFLLPAMRRGGRSTDVLARVDATFVSKSIAGAQPRDALERNLALAANVAAESRSWPALVRCVELQRAAYTAFEEGQNDWEEFWVGYVELFGAGAMEGRLLFDGRPTLSTEAGLLACALTDDAGGTAPWSEYLEMYLAEQDSDHDTIGSAHDEALLTDSERVSLNIVHGQLRLGRHIRVIKRLLAYLRESSNDFKPLFVRRLAERIGRMVGVGVVEAIARRAEPTRRAGARMTPRAATVLRLGIADELLRGGDAGAAADVATRAMETADTLELAAECLTLGSRDKVGGLRPDPSAIQIGIGPGEFLHDAKGVRAWVAAVKLAARLDDASSSALEAERTRVDGSGWYRCWLRFIIALARVDTARRAGKEADVGVAFSELTVDVRPFSGEPRACDLWPIHAVVRESLVWGLSLVRTATEWKQALDAISIAAKGTGSRMDREDGGPLPTSMLLGVLTPHLADREGGPHVRELCEQLISRLETYGTYYPTHADNATKLARARHAGGDAQSAREAWMRAAVFRASYGWHKDTTLFDIIGSVWGLRALPGGVALRALRSLQPLVGAVGEHTDGRETRHAPNAWLRSLVEVHPAVGIGVLAQTMTEDDSQSRWVYVKAVRDIVEAVGGQAEPMVLDDLVATFRFEADGADEASRIAEERLKPIRRILLQERAFGEHALRRLAAAVDGDGCREVGEVPTQLAQVAQDHGVSLPLFSSARGPSSGPRRPDRQARTTGETSDWARQPPFPPDPTVVDLLVGLRSASANRIGSSHREWAGVVSALGYHLGQLVDRGREGDALRVLRFFARDVDVFHYGGVHPLGDVAAALDAAGNSRCAAVGYALAYTASRGGGGWLQWGDDVHGYLMDRAIALDPTAARQVVADEIAFQVRGGRYSMGITKHLVERLVGWGEAESAWDVWQQAFNVVQHRLPLAPDDGWFASLAGPPTPGHPFAEWSIDEALVALLLSRLGDARLRQKVSAVYGLTRVIEGRPETAVRPLHWWLSRNASATSVLLALDILRRSERPEYLVTRGLEALLQGYAACDLFGVSAIAAELLSRARFLIASAPQIGDSTANNAPRKELTADRERALLAVDQAGVIEKLVRYWPELPKEIAVYMDALLSEPAQAARVRRRYQEAFGRDGENFPPTPVLLWETEVFELAVQRCLRVATQSMFVAGGWEAEVDLRLLEATLPHVPVHLGLVASRATRPTISPSRTDGSGPPVLLDNDDPKYAGWTRLAVVEREFMCDPARPYGRPLEAVTLFAGVVALPTGEAFPPGLFPFEEGSIDVWWSQRLRPPSFPPDLPRGRIISLNKVTDWLGDEFLLIPPIELLHYFMLEPATFGGALVWRDDDDCEAVVLRKWWEHRQEALHAEPIAREGVDLIMRPDLWDRLVTLFPVPLRETRSVSRVPIESDS